MNTPSVVPMTIGEEEELERLDTLDTFNLGMKTEESLFSGTSPPPEKSEDSMLVAATLKAAHKLSTSHKLSESGIKKSNTEGFFKRARSALPSQAKSCRFEWHNVNVYVGGARKQILNNFNGIVQSGQLLAVMGGSGAGKSTLLNALSGRTNLNEQDVEGEIAINGKKFGIKQQKLMRALCTYVPQSDMLCATQRVEEALSFYAHLKLSHLEGEKRAKRVDYLIKVLHLDSCRTNFIGDEKKRGISGGEKRRVSIASEILNDADIIFLDEPTSGLDAYTAARTIKTLKEFCNVSNKIIVATIHQPSMEVFYLFDKLILLSKGECTYNARIDDIPNYFRKELRPKTNPADVIVFEAQRKPKKYVEMWTESELNPLSKHKKYLVSQHDLKWHNYQPLTLEMIKNDQVNGLHSNIDSAPLYLQYALLLKREWQGLYRDVRVTVIRLVQVVFFAVVCGAIYFDIADSFGTKIRSFLMLTIIPLLFGIVSLLTAFPAQKLLFIRENNSGTYGATPWSLSFMLIEIPREVVHMIIFTAIAYKMIGLDGDFVEYTVTFFLTSFSGGSFGILFGTLSKTAEQAAQTVPAALIPLLIFSDGMVNLNNLPESIRWLASIDPLYYIIRCFYIIEFEGAVYFRDISSEERELCETWDSMQEESYDECVVAVYEMLNDYNYSIKVDNVTLPPQFNSSFDPNNPGDLPGFQPSKSTQTLIPTQAYTEPPILVPTAPTATSAPTTPTTAAPTSASILTPTISPSMLWLSTTQDEMMTMNVTNDTKRTPEEACHDIVTPSAENNLTMHLFCNGKIDAQRSLFDRKDLDPDDLALYWVYILLICVVMRILSIILLVVINNNGFSWLSKQIKHVFCFCCEVREERPEDTYDEDSEAEVDGEHPNMKYDATYTTYLFQPEERNGKNNKKKSKPKHKNTIELHNKDAKQVEYVQ